MYSSGLNKHVVLNKRVAGEFDERYLFWGRFQTSLGEKMLVGQNLFCEKIGLWACLLGMLEYAIVMSQKKRENTVWLHPRTTDAQ